MLGRAFVCAPDAAPDALVAKTENLPLVRIRPVGIAGGPADPGGWLWVTLTVVGLAWLAGRMSIVRRRHSEAKAATLDPVTSPEAGLSG